MQVKTTRFGTIQIEEKELITFPWGIPGFENLKSFVLLEYKNGPFQWLQSVEEPGVAFVVCSPDYLGMVYSAPDAKKKLIGLERDEDLVVLNIVSFDRETKAIHFHVKSPLLFNVAARVGYQWTMETDELKGHLAMPQSSLP
ncbi:MAG: flagellar assembly protein FliW [Deltaproteobacteria bacterium]|jgi:flagellar assembly factor FliW|nr:flagellar assembly protein FliW [Deltaproteobacteria bacterium]MDA8305935.1 flagellar assembly protein FliW [Deltaproteobacteria bacterium]